MEIGRYVLERSAEGLVISSFAGGRMSRAMTDLALEAAQGDKPIVIASGVKAGWIFGPYPETSVVVASDLTPNKACILLMLALTQTSDPE